MRDLSRCTKSVLGALAPLLLVPPIAGAATIKVTTQQDVVADDGKCSLREAVSAANTNLPSGSSPGEYAAGDAAPTVDEIRLKGKRYRLTRGGPADDLNLGGDLDITESVLFLAPDQKRAKILNGIGAPGVRGDGDRLFHVDPSGAGGVRAGFFNLKLMKGDVGCSGAGCATGASAVEVNGDGALVFESCLVVDNVGSCDGKGCGDQDQGAAIRVVGASSLRIVNSALRKNRTRCTGRGCSIGEAALLLYGAPSGKLLFQDTTLQKNSSRCSDEACSTGGIAIAAAGTVDLIGVKLLKNTVSCSGSGCTSSDGVAFFGTEDTALKEITARNHDFSCDGAGCRAPDLLATGGGEGDALLRDFVIEKNRVECRRHACTTGGQLRSRAFRGTSSGSGSASRTGASRAKGRPAARRACST